MNLTQKFYLVVIISCMAAGAVSQAQTTVYDSLDAGVVAGYSEANSANPIFGDALTLSQGGTLASVGLTLFNSTSGGNTGTIFTGTTLVKIYDNTIPYTGGVLNKPLLVSTTVSWDLTASGGLDAGFITDDTFDLSGLGVTLPQNIFITQQFTQTSGSSTRNGIGLAANSPIGSSPGTVYIKSSATSEGLYTFGGSAANGQLACSVAVFPGSGGNHQPVANPQTVTTTRDVSANITLTGSDADSDPLSFSVATSPIHGSLSGAAPNLSYQPNAGFVGSDSFTFTVNDTHTDSVPATVSITINPPPTGLVITPVWDSTILNDPNAAAIMATINTAIQVYQIKYLDPINVTIKFAEMGGGLGQSSTFISTISYSTFYNALVGDSKSTNDVVALGTITGGGSNPVTGSSSITLSTANGRALGLPNMNPPTGSPDSTISLNMSIINITRPGSNPSHYDLQAVVSHEIDEALGSTSGLPGSSVHPADLFRYSSPGVRNFTTAGDSAFFSIDGGNTLLVQYNQSSGGDYGDWWSTGSHTPRVQDAFGTPGAMPNLGVELTLLDVIGYDLAPPAPPAVLQSVGLSGGQINFTWSATYGRSYQVQYTTSLNSPNWQNTGSPVIATGPIASYSENLSDPQRFYRVGLIPQSSAAPPTDSGAKGDAGQIGPMRLETRYLLPAPGLEPSTDSAAFHPALESARRWTGHGKTTTAAATVK